MSFQRTDRRSRGKMDRVEGQGHSQGASEDCQASSKAGRDRKDLPQSLQRKPSHPRLISSFQKCERSSHVAQWIKDPPLLQLLHKGVDSIPGPGLSMCCRNGQKQKQKVNSTPTKRVKYEKKISNITWEFLKKSWDGRDCAKQILRKKFKSYKKVKDANT